MGRLTSLRISGFRRLKDVSFEMRPLTVMIGANGSGKSSILDAISLLSASAEAKLDERLGELGGIGSLISRGAARELSFDVGFEAPDLAGRLFRYHLSIAPQGAGHGLRDEGMFMRAREGESGGWSQEAPMHIRTSILLRDQAVEHRRPLLSQSPPWQGSAAAITEALRSSAVFGPVDLRQGAPIRLPQQLRPADLPGRNGQQLIPFLYSLRESEPARYDAVLDAMRAAFPTFENLTFPPVAAGMLALTWKDRAFPEVFYMNELSEGTLRFLWLAALLASPSLPAITTIDEPELSLHPELLSLLAGLMRETSARTRLIVATHSDRLIRFLKPSEVAVLDIDESGYTSFRWADSMDIGKWLDEYSLDEVWRMGRIGARA